MKEKISLLLKKIDEDNINEYSAQCSYYIILAFIPFLILLLTLIQYTGIEKNSIYNIVSILIPSTMNELVIQIIQEVYSKSIGTISISLIFSLWSAGKGLYYFIKGLDYIYEIEEEKYLQLKVKSIFNTIFFLFLITITLILLVFGRGIIDTIKVKFIFLDGIFWIILEQLILIFFAFIMNLIIFKYIPKHKVTIKSQMPGAIIGAIGLNIVSFFFSKYLVIFKGFSLIYGSLTTIMLVIMWTYACIYTMFLGAEINKLLKI